MTEQKQQTQSATLQAPPAQMKAVAIDNFGGIDTLKLRTIPVPKVGPDQILIRVESAGVGVWDPYEREGGFAEMFGTKPTFPYVLGSDGAGTVAAVGEQVKRFKPGDRVWAFGVANTQATGFYAEYTAVKEDTVAPVPENITTKQAGALPACGITALRGLDDHLHLKAGESILIFGASGGIGHLAIQLAKRMGARVFATASGEDGVGLAKRLGADAAVDGRKDDVLGAIHSFAKDGLDAALLTAGGEAAEKALEGLRDGGRVAYPNGVEPTPKPRSGLTYKNYDGDPSPQVIEKLNQLIQAGPFEVHIAQEFSLNKAADAQRALDSHYLGKIILVP